MKRISATLIMLAGVVALAAHPGHGRGNPLSPGHYAANPEHALPLALAVSLCVVVMVWGLVQVNRYEVKLRSRK